MARSQDIKTPEGTFSFIADLFTPRKRDNGGAGYGCTILFPKTTNLDALRAAAVEVAVAEWGEKAKDMIKNGLIKNPFLDGDGVQGLNKKTGERWPGYAGCVFIRCKSGADYKPRVFDRARKDILLARDAPSGSKGAAVVNAYTWENAQNGKGISFGISMVKITRVAQGDEVLGGGGGPDPDKFFETLPDDDTNVPTGKAGDGAASLFG